MKLLLAKQSGTERKLFENFILKHPIGVAIQHSNSIRRGFSLLNHLKLGKKTRKNGIVPKNHRFSSEIDRTAVPTCQGAGGKKVPRETHNGKA